MYLLGIDIGTSGTKTVIFDLKGNTIASAVSEYPLYQPFIGWAEQNPEDWWEGAVNTIREVLEKTNFDPEEIIGVGLSGQMHGLVLLDKHDRVMRSSIIWCDQRTEKECEIITDTIGRDTLISITANPALTGFTASKLMWVKHHEQEIFENIAKVLLPKDYIRFKLTGEYATEVSDASGTQLLDVPKRKWSTEVIEKLGFKPEWMPACFESQEISGTVTERASLETGLKKGTPVAGGGGDQAAGAVGNGIVQRGTISSTIGTSGVVFGFMDKVKIDPMGRVHTFCHAVPNKWHVMGVTQGAGLSMQWFKNNFGFSERELAVHLGDDPYNLLIKEADKAVTGCRGLLYLPYLMGERTPHLDPNAKGVLFGLTAKHNRNDVIRAFMEGVTYSLKDCLEIIREMDIDASEVRASGGGGKSALWRQMQADMFGLPVYTTKSTEGPALGAALIAGVGVGVYKDIKEACDASISTLSVQYPINSNTIIYEDYYTVYKGLYSALKDSFKDVSRLNSKQL